MQWLAILASTVSAVVNKAAEAGVQVGPEQMNQLLMLSAV